MFELKDPKLVIESERIKSLVAAATLKRQQVEERRKALSLNQFESELEKKTLALEASQLGQEVDALQHNLSLNNQKIRELSLTAPFDGIVIDRAKVAGAYVEPGDKLGVILDPLSLEVVFLLNASELPSKADQFELCIRMQCQPVESYVLVPSDSNAIFQFIVRLTDVKELRWLWQPAKLRRVGRSKSSP